MADSAGLEFAANPSAGGVMKSFFVQALAIGAVWAAGHAWPLALAAMPEPQRGAANAASDALALDRSLVEALGKGDGAVLERVADADFSWITAQGVSVAREDVLQAIGSGKGLKPLIGAADAQPAQAAYGSQMAVIQRHKDKMHSMHVWVKRAAGWRLLNIAEIIEYAQVPYGGTTINADCINPCSKVPFVPGNAVQQAVMAAWQDQQTGPEGWLRRVALDQIAYSTNGTRTHASRVTVMNDQKASGASIASPPLLWARIWDFGDAALMLSLQQGNNAKAVWSSRVFFERDGMWKMVESFQMYVQDALVMTKAPAK
jgi:hypothetical protein